MNQNDVRKLSKRNIIAREGETDFVDSMKLGALLRIADSLEQLTGTLETINETMCNSTDLLTNVIGESRT